MKDNLSIVITMLIFVILIVIFPLYNYFERQDDMSYNLALKATTNFVDEVLENGYLTQEMYENYTNELADTGNIYDIQLEAHRKILTSGENNNFDEQYRIDYNKDIFTENPEIKDVMNAHIVKNAEYYLNEGDQFYVKVNNSNTTMAGAIFNAIVPTASKERISVNYGGVVKNQAWAKVDAKYYDLAHIVNTRPKVKFYSKTINGITDTNDIQKENPEDGITLYPSTNLSDNLKLEAEGPDNDKSWWNKIVGHTWELKGPNISGSQKSTTNLGDKYTLNFGSMIKGEYTLLVRGQDASGNETDPTEIKISITENLTGGTGEGGFINMQELDKTLDKFLNAFPKKLHLDVYLGNTGHAYEGDIVQIYGIKSDGTQEFILNTTMKDIAKDKGTRERSFNSGKVTTKTTITTPSSYIYTDGKEYKGKNGIFKISMDIDFSLLNSDNKYEKIRIYYKNQHPNCVLNLPGGIGGAYGYEVEYN